MEEETIAFKAKERSLEMALQLNRENCTGKAVNDIIADAREIHRYLATEDNPPQPK